MQIPFVMLIFLLFSDNISGGQKSLRGQTASGGHLPAPMWKKASLRRPKIHILKSVLHLKRPHHYMETPSQALAINSF